MTPEQLVTNLAFMEKVAIAGRIGRMFPRLHRWLAARLLGVAPKTVWRQTILPEFRAMGRHSRADQAGKHVFGSSTPYQQLPWSGLPMREISATPVMRDVPERLLVPGQELPLSQAIARRLQTRPATEFVPQSSALGVLRSRGTRTFGLPRSQVNRLRAFGQDPTGLAPGAVEANSAAWRQWPRFWSLSSDYRPSYWQHAPTGW